jgi:hypothetical protein
MPNSYDNVTSTPGYMIPPSGIKQVTGPWKSGGGSRSWGGNQFRTKPTAMCLSPTQVTGIGQLYFNTMTHWKTGNTFVGFTQWYAPLSQRYGSKSVTSTDASDGTARAQNAADVKLSKGSINLLVTGGEGHETIRYVASRIATLAQAFNLIRKGNFAGAAKQLGTDLSQNASKRLARNARMTKDPTQLLANSWLEFQFGIKPLVNDVYGAVEAYHKERQAGKRVSSRSRYQAAEGGTVYRAGVCGFVKSAETRTLVELGIANPVGAAWDLVPLSFLVDWFLPLGNYFGAMGATLGLEGIGRWYSVETYLSVYAKDPNETIESLRSTYIRRVGAVGWTLPLPRFSLPNTDRLVTAASLLRRTIR